MNCPIHDEPYVYEPGGVDMPTIRGRHYCPKCQEAFNQALERVDHSQAQPRPVRRVQ